MHSLETQTQGKTMHKDDISRSGREGTSSSTDMHTCSMNKKQGVRQGTTRLKEDEKPQRIEHRKRNREEQVW